jgi:hypothetical protein
VKDKYNYEFSEITIAPLKLKYLINYDKQEYVDKSKVPADKDGWKIHPLPLLTCEGNDRGGGDFRVDENANQGNVELIGSWARNKIGVAFKKTDIPKGFKEVKFDLVERI